MLEFLNRSHDRLAQRPLTHEERAIVDANVPYATRLPDEERRELDGLIRLFLDQKRFEGCNGLELTDEMRVTIAAQACVLMLHREGDPYPDLELVLVYPRAFRSKITRRDGYVVTEGEEARLGESSDRGVVVIAWDHVNRATQHHGPGHNVVFHELAHQLDAEDGAMDGAPDLPSRSRYRQWAQVFGAAYAKLGRSLRQGTGSDIDDYGATSPAEFFAVVTEMFFERPRALRKRHAALYAELAAFYGQDPAELGSTNGGATGVLDGSCVASVRARRRGLFVPFSRRRVWPERHWRQGSPRRFGFDPAALALAVGHDRPAHAVPSRRGDRRVSLCRPRGRRDVQDRARGGQDGDPQRLSRAR